MSATSPTARTARVPVRPAERPRPTRLTVVTPPPDERSRLPFAVACIALLVLSLLGLLVLNISLSHGAYEVHDRQQEVTALSEREQLLREQLAAQAAPAQLAVQARALGMVPASAPAFIRLSDGTVLGTPQPAQDVPPPTVEVGSWQPPAPGQSAEEQVGQGQAGQEQAGQEQSGQEQSGQDQAAQDRAGSLRAAEQQPQAATDGTRDTEHRGATSTRPVGDGAVLIRVAP